MHQYFFIVETSQPSVLVLFQCPSPPHPGLVHPPPPVPVGTPPVEVLVHFGQCFVVEFHPVHVLVHGSVTNSVSVSVSISVSVDHCVSVEVTVMFDPC